MVPKPSLDFLGALSLVLRVVSGESDDIERTQPDQASARERAHMVFNAIHSAGRQWGSSLYHNGFGFFPAIVPQGTLFYHGARQNVTPTGPEWLAFEIEHAENFAPSFRARPGDGRPRPPPPGKQPHGWKPQPEPEEPRQELRRRREHDLNGDDTGRHGPGPGPGDGDDEDQPKNYRGYLHTYQAKRDLKLLLIDGMSAGKTAMGTMDSQDLVLRENNTKHNDGVWDEYARALDLCDIANEWGYDGLMRVEIGFEVIQCNFTTGLNLVSMTRTEMMENTIGMRQLSAYQWARAAGERYNDLGGDRLRIDFSSMVSGLFFPINISSTDAKRPDLMRLGAADLDDLKDLKAYLKDVATSPRRFTVNWQALADLIVSRYSKRLSTMLYESLPSKHFINEVEAATLTWFDALPLPDDVSVAESERNRTADAIERCRKHYLRPALVSAERWSLEDDLIHTSIDTVMGHVCNSLFSVRSLLQEASGSTSNGYKMNREAESEDKLEYAVKTGRAMFQRLVNTLGWTTFTQLQPCPPDEILFIAMWPFGGDDDHWNPGCRTIDQVQHPASSYWRGWGRPPKPKPSEEA
ncbi:hypothetical protein NCS52_01094100 [Fusarium sp. LHS14.1]|nr:hypothetical protein NCS52_01094100 [Fusarium sp. LHS14.1]